MQGTTSARIKQLPLRAKLAWGYTIVFSMLFAIGFGAVYLAFNEYRQQEFYHRLEAKLYLLVEGDQVDIDFLQRLHESAINRLYDEEIMMFDAGGNIIYASTAKPHITNTKAILDNLKAGKSEIKFTEGEYQILARRFNDDGKVIYGIARAYDRFGRTKVAFLSNALIGTFIVVVIILTVASFLLAGYITSPITRLARDIEGVSPKDLTVRVRKLNTSDEIALLADKFNELLERLDGAFKFQHHFIQHVSHELKTPLSVMIIRTEGALESDDEEKVKQDLVFIRRGLMELSHIVNAMLDISKTENQLIDVKLDSIRIDELLFECIDEVCTINPGKQIDFKFDEAMMQEELLTLKGNYRMLKMAFMNLLKNAIYYSAATNPTVTILHDDKCLVVQIVNDGATITEQERLKMFMHLFRGENSFGKRGFGLGLVLVERIAMLHKGQIDYSVTEDDKNCFTVKLPYA